MARFLADENYSRRVVVELRSLGHDVVTIQERGLGGIGLPDAEVLRLATAEGRAVLTFDSRDYIRLHNADPVHGGIVVCSYDSNSVALAGRIHAAVLLLPTLAGQLLRVNLPSLPTP